MKIAVLGAGIQGICASLELARLGLDVDLFDQEPRPMRRASLTNEGKIHLGLVYAKDAGLETVHLMMRGALHFMPLLERFVPAEAFHISAPFDYLVAHDSMISAASVALHFEQVDQIYKTLLTDRPELHYLGRKPGSLFRPLPLTEFKGLTQPGTVVAAFRTEELAIEPLKLGDALVLAADRTKEIHFFGGHVVKGVKRTGSQFCVFGDACHGSWAKRYSQVVNALWDGRLEIDASVGMPLPKTWNYRVKLRVLCHPGGFEFAGRSYTMLLGPYGDLVQYADGSVYLSWYPSCLRGWSTDLVRPSAWDKLCHNMLDRSEQQFLARSILDEAATDWMPCLAKLRPIQVSGGVICGSGHKDIDFEDSSLHQRHEAGVYTWEGYHSVNTGKYTMAPFFAAQIAERVAKYARVTITPIAG